MSQDVVLPIDINRIRVLLPHRYPFLLVDRVIEFDAPTRHIVAYKNVTGNEQFFQGHFPESPVMPGVLVIEALAQAGGILSHLVRGTVYDGTPSYLVKVDAAKFSKMVVPGDRLELDVTIKREIRNMMLYDGVARVDGVQVARAEILCAESKG